MVKFILLSPDGDCHDITAQLKGKDSSQRLLDNFLKKKVKVDEVETNTETQKKSKTIPFIETFINNKGYSGVKLSLISSWNLTEEYKLEAYGYLEKQVKRKTKKIIEEEKHLKNNNHELPPCKNGTNKYYGDIVMFKVNDKKQMLDYLVEDYTNDYEKLFFKDELSDSDDDESDIETEGEGEGEFNDPDFENDIGLDMDIGADQELTGHDNEEMTEELDIDLDDETNIVNDGIDYGDGEEDSEQDEEHDDDDINNGVDDDDDENEEDEELEIINGSHSHNDEFDIDNDEMDKLDKNGKKKMKQNTTLTSNGAELEIHSTIAEEDDIADENIVLEELVQQRKDIITLFEEMLKDNSLSQRIELSIFNSVFSLAKERRVLRKWDNPIFRKIYFNKARSIYTNLNKDSYINNPKLQQRIKSKKFDLDNIADMSYQELFPEHWKKLLDDKFKREKMMYEEKEEAMTDQFKCGRCKSRKCTYYELQTRSADEGMTTFITCINCGNRWKQ